MSLLEVDNLCTYFYTARGIVKAVDGISFRLEKGSVLGVVGESGSGKSITSLSIMRLIQSPPGRIVSGRVLLDGVDLMKLSEKKMQAVRGSRISMIFQEPMTALNPVFSVGEQIAEAIRLHLGYCAKDALDRTVELLRDVGIPAPEKRVKDYPHQLSGGMRQRVMIAMAISCEPDIVIADEPTTALDVTIQAQILDLINRLRDRYGMAIIMVTHNMGILSELGGSAIVMYAGRIMEEASVEQIFTEPNHPYTQGLLHAVPRMHKGDVRREKLFEIKGAQPDLIDLPPGCSFAPRCQFVMEICRRKDPPMFEVSAENKSACWLNADKLD